MAGKHQLTTIEDLKPAPYNPRRIDSEAANALGKSMGDFGDLSGLVWNKHTGHLICGHQRLDQLRARGAQLVKGAVVVDGGERFPVRVVSWTVAKEKAANVTANNPHIAGEFTDGLDGILSDIKLAIGDEDFMGLRLDDLMADIAGPKDVEQDEVPEPPKKPVTKLGDVWTLGDHRLVCGDCRETRPRKVQGCFTSPPYAEQRKNDYGGTPAEQYVQWWGDVQTFVGGSVDDLASFFLNIKPHCEPGRDGLPGSRSLYVLDVVLSTVRDFGWAFVEEYCWIHSGTPREPVNRFKNQFEPIYQFSKGGFRFFPMSAMHESQQAFSKGGGGCVSNAQGTKRNTLSGVEKFNGMAYPGNVLQCGRNTEALGHSAAFPVSLPGFFINAFSSDGDTWLDPFLGSGTTLIAAEQLGRKCYGIEISPAYCDVTVERWQNLTGKKATRKKS